MTKLAKPRGTVKIILGTPKYPLPVTVRVSDAKNNVKINGTLMHALKGIPGETIGCHLSKCAQDEKNRAAFDHPAFYASFIKTACYIVDRLDEKTGWPAHAVRYHHVYGKYVDLNDTDVTKQFWKDHPELAEREFILKVPTKSKHKPGSHGRNGEKGARQLKVPLGALRRAQKAGLINDGLAQVLLEET